jgi:hypothetical protein
MSISFPKVLKFEDFAFYSIVISGESSGTPAMALPL